MKDDYLEPSEFEVHKFHTNLRSEHRRFWLKSMGHEIQMAGYVTAFLGTILTFATGGLLIGSLQDNYYHDITVVLIIVVDIMIFFTVLTLILRTQNQRAVFFNEYQSIDHLAGTKSEDIDYTAMSNQEAEWEDLSSRDNNSARIYKYLIFFITTLSSIALVSYAFGV